MLSKMENLIWILLSTKIMEIRPKTPKIWGNLQKKKIKKANSPFIFDYKNIEFRTKNAKAVHPQWKFMVN